MAGSPTFAELIGHPVPAVEIVDVGAMATGEERYHALVASGLARVTGFEPNPAEFAKLEGRPGPYRYLPVFLGAGGPAQFHLTRYPGCSSLLAPDPGVIDLFVTLGCAHEAGNFHVVKTEAVQTTRLDDLGPEITVDFLKIDVQGAELEVMRHGTAKLADAVVIESEVEFVPLYKNQPLFGDVQCFLRERGFVLHKLIDVAGRPFRPFKPPNVHMPISQLLWADAIFVRDFARLEAYGDAGLLKAAAVLDTVYGSYDLAALLLGEFDRRHGVGLRDRYREALRGRKLALQVLNLMDRA